ncbi:hypothetical protein AB1Y20_012223 [Prymnesium parvum]|uniref:N-acylglucosamine 2-epimerase n=1 Tax=Prymnesium parvum TaxID=97485 RepID=A0AB34IQM0_PRYPA|mmetsp:Transcript_5065/g.12959  ORF Transcript_5065/g.12959 Transcript_5065/m.12959 type:complete len:431 (-) Transcript_5065:391-1683(-)
MLLLPLLAAALHAKSLPDRRDGWLGGSHIPAAPQNFFSKQFLSQQAADIIRFYDGRVRDEKGGFFQNLYINGTRFDDSLRQIVSSARMVVNFMHAGMLLGRQDLIELGVHGRDFVEKVHYVPSRDEYAFTVIDYKPADMTQQAYGYAFILAMHAASRAAGAASDDSDINRIFALLERKFFLGEEQGAYFNTIFANGTQDSYRGQNANMHLCEALIAAYEATNNITFLDRAELLAETFAVKLARKAGGFVWEHYTKDWQVDWTYNIDNPSNIYRPWGFQPGHQMEWSKNLLNLNRHRPAPWKVRRAEELFNGAWNISWDEVYGGLVYGFAPNRTWANLGDWAKGKYFWVQGETFATAALLYNTTGNPSYVERYVDLWHYVWSNWVDHKYGAWLSFNLTRDNQLINNEKASAGAKCDYHSFMACISALVAFP